MSFRLLLAGLVVAIFSVRASAAEPITFAGDARSFSVVATVTGSVSRAGAFLRVHLDPGVIRATERAHEPVRVSTFRIGLAFQKSSGVWDVARWSPRVSVNVVLDHLASTKVAEQILEIPIDGIQSIRGRWLVFAMDVSSSTGIGYTYSRSEVLNL